MTNEDKKLIADYMGWEKSYDYHEPCNPLYSDSCEGCRYVTGVVNFDLNDASLVVQEMQKRGEFVGFEVFALTEYQVYNPDMIESDNIVSEYIAWLFNAENFFAAMSQWLREGK